MQSRSTSRAKRSRRPHSWRKRLRCAKLTSSKQKTTRTTKGDEESHFLKAKKDALHFRVSLEKPNRSKASLSSRSIPARTMAAPGRRPSELVSGSARTPKSTIHNQFTTSFTAWTPGTLFCPARPGTLTRICRVNSLLSVVSLRTCQHPMTLKEERLLSTVPDLGRGQGSVRLPQRQRISEK